jgi:micrococcal nuclease
MPFAGAGATTRPRHSRRPHQLHRNFVSKLQRAVHPAVPRRSVVDMARRIVIALLLVLAAAAGAGSSGLFDEDGSRGGTARGEGRVVKVVDGDTIHVLVSGRREKVRYIGVDTPETKHPTKGVQCYGRAASAFNARLVGGQRVRLVRDVEERDRYGRLLAYVYRVRDGLFVNAELARVGYAQPLSIPPDVRHAAAFAALAREARNAKRGLWSVC